MRTDLDAGPIRVRQIFAMNYPNELLTFRRTGRQLLAMLEHDVADGEPQAWGGIAFAFDPSRPVGQRVVDSDIDPERSYTIAAEDYLVRRGERFFGEEISDWLGTGVDIVDAQIRYVQQQGEVTAPPRGRIREVTP